MKLLTRIAIALCNFIYAFHKLAPTRNRIAMISRQSNRLTLDMRLLKEEIERQDSSVEVVTMNRKIPPGFPGKIKYILYMLGPEMHAIATSRVVILEGYSINVSILHHKKDLRVIQMWHALGVLKKFAYLAVDTEEGHSSALAKAMHMHENYDYVLCSSEYCRPYYAAAFGYPESQVKVYPLPRTDLLQSDAYKQETRARILERYPALGCVENSEQQECSGSGGTAGNSCGSDCLENAGYSGNTDTVMNSESANKPDSSGSPSNADNARCHRKKNILYAPTFRNGEDITEPLHALFEAFNYEEYNLIVKLHPIDRTKVNRMEVFECPEFSTLELFSVADILVTDYSSILFEAAVAGLPVYLYTYDLDSYLERRGFIIDFKKDVPYPMFRSPVELMRAIGGASRNIVDAEAFAAKYVQPGTGNTERLAKFVLNQIRA